MSDAETPVSVPDQADSVTAAPEAPQAKPRRRRRTKAEMEAARAAEAKAREELPHAEESDYPQD